MKIIIFGASGQVGLRLTAEMLRRGHKVTAFVFGPNPFMEDKDLRVIRGDVHDATEVERAIEGSDAVLSSLGSWGTKSKDILASGMQSIIPAMEKHKITRIVSLTGAAAWDAADKPGPVQGLSHRLITLAARRIVEDGEEHIRLLRASRLDWTVVRSPLMSDYSRRGSYRLRRELPMPWAIINRGDVAIAMADLIESGNYRAEAPVIYRA